MLRTFIDKYMYIVTVVIVQQARFPSQTYLKPNGRWQGSTLCGLKKMGKKNYRIELSDRKISNVLLSNFLVNSDYRIDIGSNMKFPYRDKSI